MDEILDLFYKIQVFHYKMNTKFRENQLLESKEYFEAKEQITKLVSTFITYILPTLMQYARKGEGRICKYDLRKIRLYFIEILSEKGNAPSNESLFFKYALGSTLDIINSDGFKIKYNQIDLFSDIFDFFEKNMISRHKNMIEKINEHKNKINGNSEKK